MLRPELGGALPISGSRRLQHPSPPPLPQHDVIHPCDKHLVSTCWGCPWPGGAFRCQRPRSEESRGRGHGTPPYLPHGPWGPHLPLAPFVVAPRPLMPPGEPEWPMVFRPQPQAPPAPGPYNSVLPEMISRASESLEPSRVFWTELGEQMVGPKVGAGLVVAPLNPDSPY